VGANLHVTLGNKSNRSVGPLDPFSCPANLAHDRSTGSVDSLLDIGAGAQLFCCSRNGIERGFLALEPLLAMRGTITLLFAARDEAHNNAVALAEWLRGQNSAS